MKHLTVAACCLASMLAQAQPQPQPPCQTTSPGHVVPVVELYTSEGCSSCPPADRWLSRLARESTVVALAFHVNYWDRLGWRDRFASESFTQRQQAQRAVNGAPYSYTPQVVVQGLDRRDWRTRPVLPRSDEPARLDITLSGQAGAFTAELRPRPAAPQRLAAFWAVTEDGHASRVTAGENAGERLLHDHVVRELQPVPVWSGSARLRFTPGLPPDPAHPRGIALVVTDADTGRPVQAIRLAC